MTRITQRLIILAFVLLLNAGCYSTGSRGANNAGIVLFVPGAGGDGTWYRGVNDGLRDAGETRTIRTVTWGMPGPFFVMNFNDKGVHDRAEQKLADEIAKQPTGPIDVVAHSAGCGVTLGALKRLPEGVHVRRVLLMNPSVSPSYELDGALARAESIDVFRSERDTLFLSWRVSNFGTYDGVKTKAAGNVGFATNSPKVRQHAWTEADESLGHDGGHFGATSRTYVARVYSQIREGEAPAEPMRMRDLAALNRASAGSAGASPSLGASNVDRDPRTKSPSPTRSTAATAE